MKSKPELSKRANELASYLKREGITCRGRYLYTGTRVQRIKFWKLGNGKDEAFMIPYPPAPKVIKQCVKRLEKLGLNVKLLEQRWIGTSIVVYFTDENIVKKLKLPKYRKLPKHKCKKILSKRLCSECGNTYWK